MNSTHDIVALKPNDDPGEAAALLTAFFAEEGFSAPAGRIEVNLRCMLELDICHVLVVRESGAAVAVATLSLDYGIEFGWAAEIGDLYVVPAARGRGMARALVEACRDIALGCGATNLYVTVTAHGEEAGLDDFYSSLGFSGEGRRILAQTI